MTQVVGAYVWLEAVRGAGQRLAHHTSVVHQDVNGFHRVREPSHAGQVGQIQMTDLDVACQLGSGLLGLGDGPAGNHHAVIGGGQRPSGGFTDAAVAPGDDDAHGGLRSSSADLFVCGFECPPRQRGGGEYVRARSRSTLWRISLVLLRPNVSFGVRRLATSARSRMSSIVVVDTPRSRNSSNAAPRIRSRTSCLRTRGVGLTFAEASLNRRGSERPGAWMRLVGRSSRTAAAAGLPRAAAVRDDGVAKPRGSAAGIAV